LTVVPSASVTVTGKVVIASGGDLVAADLLQPGEESSRGFHLGERSGTFIAANEALIDEFFDREAPLD
jgi:hypothetical protein